jgi:hypothetical protein
MAKVDLSSNRGLNGTLSMLIKKKKKRKEKKRKKGSIVVKSLSKAIPWYGLG